MEKDSNLADALDTTCTALRSFIMSGQSGYAQMDPQEREHWCILERAIQEQSTFFKFWMRNRPPEQIQPSLVR